MIASLYFGINFKPLCLMLKPIYNPYWTQCLVFLLQPLFSLFFPPFHSIQPKVIPKNSMFLREALGEGSGNPLQHSCLENPMDRGAWWVAVHGVATSRARLSNFTFTFYFPALEKEVATHSSVLAWRIPGTAEPGGLPSVGSHRVGHDWSNLAAAAAAAREELILHSWKFIIHKPTFKWMTE